MAFLIGVAGPSASGKSTVCKLLESDSVGHVPMDYFFKSKEEHSGSWDIPEAIKMNDFYSALLKLKKNEAVVIPKRSRKTQQITGEVELKPKPVFLIEGFMSLYDEKVRNLLDLKIFISVPKTIQLERRMKRYEESGMLFNHDYFNSHVYPGYLKYVKPAMKYADFVIDGRCTIEENASQIKKITERFINNLG